MANCSFQLRAGLPAVSLFLMVKSRQASAIEAEHNNAHRNSAIYMLKVVE